MTLAFLIQNQTEQDILTFTLTFYSFSFFQFHKEKRRGGKEEEGEVVNPSYPPSYLEVNTFFLNISIGSI